MSLPQSEISGTKGSWFPDSTFPEELPPSDIVPGIAPVAVDYDWALSEIERLQSKLDELKPFVVRVGGSFVLYQGKEIRVQTPDSQLMQDYLNATWPLGTKIKWFVLPVDQSLNPS